jgi:hypothetical protein
MRATAMRTFQNLSIQGTPTRGAVLGAEIVGILMSLSEEIFSKIRKEDLWEI